MRYRRTQFGWALVIGLGIPAAILITVARSGDTWAPLLGLIPLVLIFPLFGWLTVSVEDDVVAARFGIGALTYRIPLTTIISTEVVHNPWTWGWGVRIIPGGRMYNVSGLRSVEFTLADGQRVRIGTDDPEGLQAAVQSVVPPGRMAHSPDIVATPAISRIVAPIVLVVVATVLALLWLATRPIVVTTDNGTLRVEGGGYHASVPFSDVKRVHLDDALPSFRARTNGVGVGGELRGHFRLADGHTAQVFVSRNHPPFITVETSSDPIVFNMSNPAATRKLFGEVAARVSAP